MADRLGVMCGRCPELSAACLQVARVAKLMITQMGMSQRLGQVRPLVLAFALLGRLWTGAHMDQCPAAPRNHSRVQKYTAGLGCSCSPHELRVVMCRWRGSSRAARASWGSRWGSRLTARTRPTTSSMRRSSRSWTAPTGAVAAHSSAFASHAFRQWLLRIQNQHCLF